MRGAERVLASGCWRSGSGAARQSLLRRAIQLRRNGESRREQRRHDRLSGTATQLDLSSGQADVDLAADAEASREVDPRLDRKAGVRQVPPGIAGLEIIVVHAVAVAVVVDAVAGAVQEAFPVAGVRDHIACRGIHLGAAGELAEPGALPQQLHGRVARLEDVTGNALDLRGDTLAEEIDPRQIAIDTRGHEARAEVEQEQTVAARQRAAFGRRRVMWIRRVGIDRDPRPALDVESLPRPARPRELLQPPLRGPPGLAP